MSASQFASTPGPAPDADQLAAYFDFHRNEYEAAIAALADHVRTLPITPDTPRRAIENVCAMFLFLDLMERAVPRTAAIWIAADHLSRAFHRLDLLNAPAGHA